jgi:hypothetical protein
MSADNELKAVASIAGRHKMMRGIAERQVDSMTKMFILMCADHDPNRLFDLLDAVPVWKSMDSSVFGITTIIKDYTNKKDITFKAHFTINGKFLKKAGDEKPISYIGNFRVCKAVFKIDMDKLDEIVGMYMSCEEEEEVNLSDLFIVKDSDDIPLDYFGNTGRIARKTY